MKVSDAEAICTALKELTESPFIADRGMFQLERLWIENDGDDTAVCVVFRQGQGPLRIGCRQRDLVSIVTGDRAVTPDEMARDLYDFVLVEPHDPEPLLPDADGVRWFGDA